MDLKQIKQLVELVSGSDLTEFTLEEKDFKLKLRRLEACQAPVVAAPMAAVPQAGPAAAPAPEPPAEVPGKLIKSPMVGTFYAAPSPDSAPFVKVGDSVQPESVVCIIEAMKVMNEIKAELAGNVTEILVNNGDSVEYGQPLFRIR